MILCIQDITFEWSKQRHYSLYVQKEKEQDYSHTEGLKHYHVQLQEYPHPSDISGIHHGVYKDIDWTLEIIFSIFLVLLSIC